MLQRIVPVSRSLLRAQAVQPVRRYAHGFKPETAVVKEHQTSLSDIPIPQGPWAEYHNKRNSKWTMLLAASVGFWALTMAVMYKEGVWYLHGHPSMKNK